MERFEPKIKLISASAGTGKTYSLVQEINKALKDTEPSKIVAITFTRAATRDIRNRIQNVEDLNINTIHGFFAGILREQSLYFRHCAEFRILEDFDDKKLFRDVASEVMIKKVNDPEYGAFFAEYNFENVLLMLQKLEGHYAVIRDKLSVDVRTLFEQEKKAEHQKFKELVPDDFKVAVAYPILTFKASSDKDKLEEIRKTVLPFVSELAESLDDVQKSASLLKKMPLRAPGASGSVKYWDKEQLAKVKDALKTLHTIRESVVEDYRIGEEWVAEEAARNRKLFFDLFGLVHPAYENRKKELDVLSYNDVERLTYDLVTKNPRVAHYYREKYDHIFVDEFQDTNKMQRDVLFAIAKQLFLVGDAKQSIYRFRNADVRVFIDTQNRCSKDEIEELKGNRRCSVSIVDAVNKAFPDIFGCTHSAQRRDFEADYLEFEAVRKDEAPGGVRFINAFNHNSEAQIALDIMEKGLAAGKGYKDFVLLFRASNHMPEFERLFREKGLPFVVYGGESRNDLFNGLRSLFNVILDPYDDHSMLEVLKLPRFYVSEQEVYELKKNKACIWDGLTTEPVKGFISDMRKIKDHGGFTEFVAEVLRTSSFIPSASLVFTGQDVGAEETILRAARHVESVGEGIEYFLDFLYGMKAEDIATEIDAVKLMTVHASKGLEFDSVIIPCLDYVPKVAKDSLVISDDGDVAVKLGEDDSNRKFNTVLYRNIKDNEKEADIAESKRLLYVAMTRAKNDLYLLSDLSKGKGIQGDRWVDWLSAIFSDRMEDHGSNVQRNDDLFRRKVVRVLPGPSESLPVTRHSVPRRYTASSVRDHVSGTGHENAGDSSIRLGNMIHSILENWKNKDAVNKVYESIGKEAAAPVSSIVDSFVVSELGKKLFSASKYLAEHSFAVRIDDNIVSGRIDRINIHDDHVWVVDYKSSVDEKELEGYKAQLACYMCFAESSFKDKKIIGSIIDVNKSKEYAFNIKELKPWIKDVIKRMSLDTGV